MVDKNIHNKKSNLKRLKPETMKRIIYGSMIAFLLFSGCGNTESEAKKEQNLGIGPFEKVLLGPIDPSMVARGEEKFNQICATCHKVSEEHIGPQMAGITKKRSPEWILNMIINPMEMTAKDPDAKILFEKYKVPMPDPGISQGEARDIFEFIRSIDQ